MHNHAVAQTEWLGRPGLLVWETAGGLLMLCDEWVRKVFPETEGAVRIKLYAHTKEVRGAVPIRLRITVGGWAWYKEEFGVWRRTFGETDRMIDRKAETLGLVEGGRSVGVWLRCWAESVTGRRWWA